MSSSSGSESDPEEKARLEAAAVDLNMFPEPVETEHHKSSEKAGMTHALYHPSQHVLNQPSKRLPKEQQTVDELGTTPEFKSHVANKLSEALCSNIKMKSVWMAEVDVNPGMLGIQLFSSSKPITDIKTNTCIMPQRRTRTESSDSSEDEAALASVAVSGEWILSQGSLQKNCQTTS